MPILHLVVATAITLVSAQDCPDWRACRDSAVASASHEEYESFHDYAWRAVQKGPKNDPDLMLLLARAHMAALVALHAKDVRGEGGPQGVAVLAKLASIN